MVALITNQRDEHSAQKGIKHTVLKMYRLEFTT